MDFEGWVLLNRQENKYILQYIKVHQTKGRFLIRFKEGQENIPISGPTYRNARKKCEYFNSANCAHCFPLALFWCAVIRLPHMRVCFALAVVAQIKIAHNMQMSNFVQIALYYSRTFF